MKEITDYKPVIIGVDHGYGNIKTEHCVFPSGVERTTHHWRETFDLSGR